MWWFSRELGKKTDKNQSSRGNEKIQKLEGDRKLLPIKHDLGTCILGEEVVGVVKICLGFFEGEGAWLFTKSAVTLSLHRTAVY